MGYRIVQFQLQACAFTLVMSRPKASGSPHTMDLHPFSASQRGLPRPSPYRTAAAPRSAGAASRRDPLHRRNRAGSSRSRQCGSGFRHDIDNFDVFRGCFVSERVDSGRLTLNDRSHICIVRAATGNHHKCNNNQHKKQFSIHSNHSISPTNSQEPLFPAPALLTHGRRRKPWLG